VFAQFGSRDFATGPPATSCASAPDCGTVTNLTAEMPDDGGSRLGADLTTAIG